MSQPRLIPIENLVRRPEARPMSEDDLTALERSISEVGLLNPLTVRAVPGGSFEIIAGSHRFAACDGLGHREIPCHVVAMNDVYAELAMIDENLCRAELSPSDRARQTARRKVIYVELHPETRTGVAGAVARHSATDNLSTASFAEATADATGRDARSVRRDAERGEKVIDEVLDMIRGSQLDTGTYLDKLKRLPPNEQVHAARRDLAIDRKKVRDAAKRNAPARAAEAASPRSPASADENAYARFIQLADEVEALRVGDLIASAGRQRSTLGQRASGLADMMSDIMEGVNR